MWRRIRRIVAVRPVTRALLIVVSLAGIAALIQAHQFEAQACSEHPDICEGNLTFYLITIVLPSFLAVAWAVGRVSDALIRRTRARRHPPARPDQ